MIALTEQERRILSLVTPVAESLGMEIVRQHQEPLDALFVPVGGGGLLIKSTLLPLLPPSFDHPPALPY